MPHARKVVQFVLALSLLGFVESAAAQSVHVNANSHQLSLVGLRPASAPPAKEDNRIAIVVSNRTVIQHYQSAPKRISQLKRQFGGCGCGL